MLSVSAGMPALLLVALTARQPAPATEGPFPDVNLLLAEVLENQNRVDQAREDYTYTMTVEDLKMDSRGGRTPGRVRTYEVFHVAGKQFRKLTAVDGRPLSSGEARKEDERVAKAVRQHRERVAGQDRTPAPSKPADTKPGDGDDVAASDILRLSRLVNPRREQFRGQPALAYDFEPRPDAKPHGRRESWLAKMGGRLWVDEQAKRLLRLEARVTEALKVAGGLVISLRPGSSFAFEQAVVNEEIWLPTFAEIHLSARFLLLKGVEQHQQIRIGDYRKFAVETFEVKAPRP